MTFRSWILIFGLTLISSGTGFHFGVPISLIVLGSLFLAGWCWSVSADDGRTEIQNESESGN
jgi:hypothetical protein